MNVLCPKCGASVETVGSSATCGACGATFLAGEAKTSTEAAEPKDPLLGKTIGGCELLERVGAGGMGVVYKARQLSLRRTVAVKLLPEQLRKDKEIEERFRREISILARLSHPNIVSILDGGISEHGAFFVMEYVDGVSLRRVLASGGVTPPEALRVIPQICDALEYAHQRDVIHRDIKPENILLDRDGRVRLLDFGLSRILKTEEPGLVTRTTQVLGTFEYMAPEQREASRTVDHRADLYSLGVVIYEMLTGELPIGRFDPPSKRNVQIDVRLDEVVLRVLDKSPDRRYQRASEIKTEVERISTTSPPVVGVAAAAPGSGAPRPTPHGFGGLAFGRVAAGPGAEAAKPGFVFAVEPPWFDRWWPFVAVLVVAVLSSGEQWVAAFPILALLIGARRVIDTAPPRRGNRIAWFAIAVVAVAGAMSPSWPLALPLLGVMIGSLYHFRHRAEHTSEVVLWVAFIGLGILSAASGGERAWIVALLAATGAFVVVMLVDQAQMKPTTPPPPASPWSPPPPPPSASPWSPPPPPPSASPSGSSDAPPTVSQTAVTPPPISEPPIAARPAGGDSTSAFAVPRVSGFARASMWCAIAGLVCIAVLYALAVPYFLGVGR